MYLTRFDYPTAHGWMARARKANRAANRFFSDRAYGSPDAARSAAEAYRAEHEARTGETLYPHDVDRSPRSNNLTGIPGVCLVVCSPRSKSGHAWTFWAATCPGGPEGDKPSWSKKFTCSVHGFDRARQLAIEFREAYLVARDAGTLREFWGVVEEKRA